MDIWRESERARVKQKGERANRGCGWAECSSGREGGREGAAVGEAGCEWSERKGERPPARPRQGREKEVIIFSAVRASTVGSVPPRP